MGHSIANRPLFALMALPISFVHIIWIIYRASGMSLLPEMERGAIFNKKEYLENKNPFWRTNFVRFIVFGVRIYL